MGTNDYGPKIKKIEFDADPERCQATMKFGQCINKITPGSTTACCAVHGGVVRKSMRNYHTSKWNARIQAHAESDFVKSLREEIGILRMILEETLERCVLPVDLVLQSGVISDLILKVEKVVVSCHRLEGSMGELLDKQTIMQFAANIITIIEKVVDNKVTVRLISDKILDSLTPQAFMEMKSVS